MSAQAKSMDEIAAELPPTACPEHRSGNSKCAACAEQYAKFTKAYQAYQREGYKRVAKRVREVKASLPADTVYPRGQMSCGHGHRGPSHGLCDGCCSLCLDCKGFHATDGAPPKGWPECSCDVERGSDKIHFWPQDSDLPWEGAIERAYLTGVYVPDAEVTA